MFYSTLLCKLDPDKRLCFSFLTVPFFLLLVNGHNDWLTEPKVRSALAGLSWWWCRRRVRFSVVCCTESCSLWCFFDVVVVVVLGYFPSRAKGKALHSRSQLLSYSDSYGDTDRQWQWLWRIACLSFGLFDCAKSSSPFNVFVCWNNSGCLLLISFCFCLSFYCWLLLLLLMLLWYVVPHFHLCGQLFTVPFFHLFFLSNFHLSIFLL